MALCDVNFSDLYLGRDKSWVSGIPGTSDPVPVPDEDIEESKALRIACETYRTNNPSREDFPIRHAEVSYRASIMPTIDETVYVLRRLSEKVRLITDLGIPLPMVNSVMVPNLTGLFIVSGTFGQGKTTTASALVASRIAKFGGVAITVEDPPEQPLHGRHGEGVCYQTWVGPGGFGHACRQASRWAPSIMFLGEIRDSETAIEALRAAINGKLVICTAHADNAAMAIERIFALANTEGSSADDILGMLATGLTAVIHQKLESTGTRKQLLLESLFIVGEDEAAARQHIRRRQFEQLKNLAHLQKNRMIMNAGRQTNASVN